MPIPSPAILNSLPEPVWRSRTTQRVAAGTTTNDPGKPAGTIASDLLIAHIDVLSLTDTVATPTGWTKPTGAGPIDTTGGAALRGYVMYAPGSVAGTSFTKTGTGGAWRVTISAIPGATVIDHITSAASSANGTAVLSAGVTPTVADTLRFVAVCYSNTTTCAPPNGFAPGEVYEETSAAPSAEASANYLYAAGAVAACTSTLGTNAGWVVFDMALRQ